ncbi:MAG TPA: hypothetical protein VFG74_13005 [Miltoncostaeaceae bacterium]|nr:hypothetical protein [Miltoncostaeaceae bacterium]
MRRTHRRLLLALGAVAAAVALAGCVNIKQFTGSQPNPAGAVQIVTQLCRGGTAPDCADDGNSNFNPTADVDAPAQLLVAYRVSAGSIPPAALRFFDDGGQGPELVPSPSYTAELQRLQPAPAGQRWFGYIATPFTYPASLPALPIFTKFGLPPAADGSPVSTYAYMVVVGWRETGDGIDPTRPVSCGSSLFTLSSGVICIDSPNPSDTTSWKTLSGLTDMGIRGGTSAPVAAGGAGTVPFTLRANAIPGNLTAALATSTSAPSGSATVSPATVALVPNGGRDVNVRVAVNEGTPPGDYPVTLTATVGSDRHTGQGIVRVVRPGAGGGGGGGGGGVAAGLPTISAKVAPTSIRRTRTATPAVVTAILSDPGTVRMAVSRAAAGRRKGRACAAPTRALIRNGARRCTRFVAVTSVTRAGLGAGRRTIAFSGRRRAAGTYRLTLTLRAGGLVSRPVVVTVTVRP